MNYDGNVDLTAASANVSQQQSQNSSSPRFGQTFQGSTSSQVG